MIGLLILFATALALLLTILTALLVREMRRPPRHTAGYALAKGMACDPGEIGLTFTEWTLDRPGGLMLPVWEVVGKASRHPGIEASRKEDRLTAVFVHGWGHGRIDSLARIGSLAELCDRVVMYDLRGHGEANGLSRLGDGEDDDLLALLERLGDSRFLLIGHSMGAVIAMHAAAKTARSGTNRISGVIAFAPYLDFRSSLRGRLKRSGYPTRPLTDLALGALRVMGIMPLSLTEEMVATLPCPLLVVHGTQDIVAPLSHGQHIAAAARQATLCVIHGAEHADAHEKDAKRVDAVTREFVGRLEVKCATEVAGP